MRQRRRTIHGDTQQKKRNFVASSQFSRGECANCGQPLMPGDRFCPGCGQKKQDLTVPFRRLISEIPEGLLHYDSKTFQTIIALVLRPGFLTSEYTGGKRVRYVAPVRLYVFVSFVFFLLLTIPSGEHNSPGGKEDISKPIDITFFDISSLDVGGMNQAQLDSVMQARSMEQTATNRYVVRQLARVGSPQRGEFTHTLVRGISYMMFALMPVFALAVYWLNRKKARYFIGALVFSIHYHSAVFLLLSVLVVVNRAINSSIVWLLPFVFLPVYLWFSLGLVYKDRWLVVIFKSILINILHIVSFVLLFILTVFVSLLIF